jgi:hypothetical protein
MHPHLNPIYLKTSSSSSFVGVVVVRRCLYLSRF